MAVSELPGNPNAVWTVKKNIDGKRYLVILDLLDFDFENLFVQVFAMYNLLVHCLKNL